ncbi:hypothetical protein B0H19DRAFT_220897 [Mycena capillaripes]|nr:hypothetical protein B0H19DRAFT_220897 [Mycena capillaripes]
MMNPNQLNPWKFSQTRRKTRRARSDMDDATPLNSYSFPPLLFFLCLLLAHPLSCVFLYASPTMFAFPGVCFYCISSPSISAIPRVAVPIYLNTFHFDQDFSTSSSRRSGRLPFRPYGGCIHGSTNMHEKKNGARVTAFLGPYLTSLATRKKGL